MLKGIIFLDAGNCVIAFLAIAAAYHFVNDKKKKVKLMDNWINV